MTNDNTRVSLHTFVLTSIVPCVATGNIIDLRNTINFVFVHFVYRPCRDCARY